MQVDLKSFPESTTDFQVTCSVRVGDYAPGSRDGIEYCIPLSAALRLAESMLYFEPSTEGGTTALTMLTALTVVDFAVIGSLWRGASQRRRVLNSALPNPIDVQTVFNNTVKVVARMWQNDRASRQRLGCPLRFKRLEDGQMG